MTEESFPVPRRIKRQLEYLKEEEHDIDVSLSEIDSIEELSPEDAFLLGRKRGKQNVLQALSSAVSATSAIYFQTVEELTEKLHEKYNTSLYVSDIDGNVGEDTQLTVHLGYSWVELPEAIKQAQSAEEIFEQSQVAFEESESHRVSRVLSEEANKYQDGYIVNFGPPGDTRIQAKREAEDRTGENIL